MRWVVSLECVGSDKNKMLANVWAVQKNLLEITRAEFPWEKPQIGFWPKLRFLLIIYFVRWTLKCWNSTCGWNTPKRKTYCSLIQQSLYFQNYKSSKKMSRCEKFLQAETHIFIAVAIHHTVSRTIQNVQTAPLIVKWFLQISLKVTL